jgi:hypothetical protein
LKKPVSIHMHAGFAVPRYRESERSRDGPAHSLQGPYLFREFAVS